MKEEISNKIKKIISIISILSLVALLLIIPFSAEESTDHIITIYDNDELITIPISEVQQAYGDSCCVAVSFRAAKTAFCEWDGIPVRGKTEIISAQPSNGSIGTFEYILGSSEYVTVDLPQGTDIVNLTLENFHYQFIDTSTNGIVVIDVKESTFPDGFFELRKKCKENTATPEEKAEFKLMKSQLRNTLLDLPAEDLFDVTTVKRLEGDVTATGLPITGGDAQLVAQHIVHAIQLTGEDAQAADVNDNQDNGNTASITGIDLQLIKQFVVHSITEFPGGEFIP